MSPRVSRRVGGALLSGFVALALLVACGEPQPKAPAEGGAALPAGWRDLDPESFSPAQAAQSRLAQDAQQRLFARLSQRLMQAMGEPGGIPGAIGACQLDAPALATSVEKELGLSVGRTSWKLRNPRNVPPDWARRDVAARRASATWLAHEDGRLAALLPIRLMGLCVVCHGNSDQLAEGVPAALAARYPSDQATGFSEGDLRGWFWIEVPVKP